jgi:hypothetical protein
MSYNEYQSFFKGDIARPSSSGHGKDIYQKKGLARDCRRFARPTSEVSDDAPGR